MGLEKTLKSLLDSKEINQSILKEINPNSHWKDWCWSWGSLWPPDAKSWLTGKDPDAGKGWRQKEKGTTEDEMVGWHHWLDGHEFEQTPGDSEGQGSMGSMGSQRVRHDWVTEQQTTAIVQRCFWQVWPKRHWIFLKSIPGTTHKVRASCSGYRDSFPIPRANCVTSH